MMLATQLTALFDFGSVIAALIIAIQGRLPIRGGKNDYERKKDLRSTTWNKIWTIAFWAALAAAAASFFIKTFWPNI